MHVGLAQAEGCLPLQGQAHGYAAESLPSGRQVQPTSAVLPLRINAGSVPLCKSGQQTGNQQLFPMFKLGHSQAWVEPQLLPAGRAQDGGAGVSWEGERGSEYLNWGATSRPEAAQGLPLQPCPAWAGEQGPSPSGPPRAPLSRWVWGLCDPRGGLACLQLLLGLLLPADTGNALVWVWVHCLCRRGPVDSLVSANPCLGAFRGVQLLCCPPSICLGTAPKGSPTSHLHPPASHKALHTLLYCCQLSCPAILLPAGFLGFARPAQCTQHRCCPAQHVCMFRVFGPRMLP